MKWEPQPAGGRGYLETAGSWCRQGGPWAPGRLWMAVLAPAACRVLTLQASDSKASPVKAGATESCDGAAPRGAGLVWELKPQNTVAGSAGGAVPPSSARSRSPGRDPVPHSGRKG